MWLWQHKNIHKRHLLWAKLFGICFVFHCFFLLWIFCIYHDSSYTLSLCVSKQFDYSTPIIFAPSFTPSTPMLRGTPSKASTNTAPVKKSELKQKTIITQAPKQTPAPTPMAPKKEELKTEAQKPSSFAKASADAPNYAKATSDKAPVKKEKIIAPVIPDNAHISNNYREVEALRLSAQLQKELVHTWKPPIGVSPDCMCEISFFVTQNGALENLTMIKSSGVVMYDISARQALFSMKMPQWTYNKQLNICFKQ
jgi:hypothetical protein